MKSIEDLSVNHSVRRADLSHRVTAETAAPKVPECRRVNGSVGPKETVLNRLEFEDSFYSTRSGNLSRKKKAPMRMALRSILSGLG